MRPIEVRVGIHHQLVVVDGLEGWRKRIPGGGHEKRLHRLPGGQSAIFREAKGRGDLEGIRIDDTKTSHGDLCRTEPAVVLFQNHWYV